MSELENRSFSCVEGCALCCLCQPELNEIEYDTFKSNPFLLSGLTRKHIDGHMTKNPSAIKLQGGCGGCFFLKDRRCRIYDSRPHFCKQFPVQVHALRKVQMCANLSCRGISDKDNSLIKYAQELQDDSFLKQAEIELNDAKHRVRLFDIKCEENGIHQSPERLISVGNAVLPLILLEDGIGKVLAYTNGFPEIHNTDINEVLNEIESINPVKGLIKLANDTNYEQLEIENIAWLPLYTDENLNWYMFRSNNGKIQVLKLDENGTYTIKRDFPLEEIGLISRSGQALEIFRDYVKTLVHRDSFLGYVYHVCAEENYQYDLMTVYLGVLATTTVDLWWRSSLIGRIKGKSEIDTRLAFEGIKAFDMDCLDLPTIGTFF